MMNLKCSFSMSKSSDSCLDTMAAFIDLITNYKLNQYNLGAVHKLQYLVSLTKSSLLNLNLYHNSTNISKFW